MLLRYCLHFIKIQNKVECFFLRMWSFKTKSNEWVSVHYGHILLYHYNDPISLTPSVQLAETLEREFESTINTTHKRWLLFEKMCEDRRQKVTQFKSIDPTGLFFLLKEWPFFEILKSFLL